MLQVDHLRAGYGHAEVLHDISITVDDAEIVAILGPNGAGKTTLVNCIAGMKSASAGSIRFEGSELSTLAPHRVSDMGIALVPEGRRIFPKMTVAENLDIGSYGKTARAAHDEKMADVLEIFPRLGERSEQLAGTLSGGEQQMLAVGRALMAGPRLLLLDEPSLGLAPIIVESIFGVLDDINSRGVSILLVEQNAMEALDLATRGYVLEQGRIVGEGPAVALAGDERLRKAYLGF